MTLYLLKVHPQTFLSTPLTQKFQISSCDTLVANERYKKHDLIVDIKRKRWLGHVTRMGEIKVTKKREICIFWNTGPRRFLSKVSAEPATAINRIIRQEHDTSSPSHFITEG